MKRLLDRLTGRRVRQLEAERELYRQSAYALADELKRVRAERDEARRDYEDVFAINEGIRDKIAALAVPLPGEERVEGEKWNLN